MKNRRKAETTNPTGPDAALLDAARAIFISEGIKGLSVRRVAEKAGCTTMAVYSRFGGKEGIVGALFDEGFAALASAQFAADATLPPAERVMALCRAYRKTAHTYPHHYALMLGHFSGEHQASLQSQDRALATLNYLIDAVSTTIPKGKKRKLVATEKAHRLFAFCHGWVSLEITGFFGDEQSESAFDKAINALLAG